MKATTPTLLILMVLFTSCSSYINSVYRDLDREERAHIDSEDEAQNREFDQFDQYRKNTKRRTSSVYNKPKKNRKSQELTTEDQRIVSPNIKRKYQDEKTALKRTTASDLTDSGNDGSLWTSNDPNAFLFSTSRSKNTGDIVQINVMNKLKNEISLELKRAFPDNPYEQKAKTKGGDGDKNDDNKNPTSASSPAESSSTSGDPQDKISGVVIEEINREHLLVKGRKNVLFKSRKRLVEVQALVSRKDIADDDVINSDTILETSVSVIR